MAENMGFLEIPEIDLASYKVDPDLLRIISPAMVQKHKMVPLFKVGNTLTVAMADPRNIDALDELRTTTKMDVSVAKATLPDIQDFINDNYGIAGMVDTFIREYSPPSGGKQKAAAPSEAPIMKLVDIIIFQAVRERASDIHIEPGDKDVRIRYRVDGFLHEELALPKHMLAAVVSRVKILGAMNIAESRIPQDGRFEIEHEGKKVDMRVSTFPSSFGENVVMRILDKSSMLYQLAEIGFSKENLDKFEVVLRKPHGIVLVTGPTGSGKTTTLYAALSVVNKKEINLITVEDPIEYELPGVTQSQINVKAGLTFGTALRAILRQDPDVIFIGEIRDLETAEIAIQSAMTGHLVFSSFHTNDAPGALTRLIEMGVEPFLISSSVEAILAQRLVRTICEKCLVKEAAPRVLTQKFPGVKTVQRGKGCKACKNTGFRGRIGIFELLVVDENIRKMITTKTSSDEIRNYAIGHGMRTLLDDGLEKVKAGITTIEEVLRVTELEQI